MVHVLAGQLLRFDADYELVFTHGAERDRIESSNEAVISIVGIDSTADFDGTEVGSGLVRFWIRRRRNGLSRR